MGSLNQVNLIGHLGNDCEVRAGQDGRERATFRMATNRCWVDGSGSVHEATEWHNIVY